MPVSGAAVQAGAADAGAGKLMTVGAFGLGGDALEDMGAEGAFVRAEAAFVTTFRDRKEVHLTLEGDKTLGHRFAGTLGPLGRTPDSMYEFSCEGPLVLVVVDRKDSSLRASGKVELRNAQNRYKPVTDLHQGWINGRAFHCEIVAGDRVPISACGDVIAGDADGCQCHV